MDFFEYFGFKDDPFRLTPDPNYFYPSEVHTVSLKSLEYSISQGEGICIITGEPGTGKTTLLNVFLQTWKEKLEVALILTPKLMPEEFLSSVFEDLGLDVRGLNKNEMIRKFKDFLINKVSGGKRVVIIVDEAQNLPAETLEELRLLSNIETYKEKLMQIVLVGQPELNRLLSTGNLRQLNQRIATRITLIPFTYDDTVEYIKFRLIKAGRPFLKYDNSALKKIFNLSRGIPRVINIIALRTMMAAYLDETTTVSKKYVRYAVKSLNLQGDESKPVKKVYWLVPAIVVFLVIAIFSALNKDVILDEVKVLISDNEGPKSAIEERYEQEVSFQKSNKGPDIDLKTNKSQDYKLTIDKGRIKIQEEKVPANKATKNQYYAVVKTKAANIRIKPGLHSKKIGFLRNGSKLLVLDEVMDDNLRRWLKIKMSNNLEGWVSEHVVNVILKD